MISQQRLSWRAPAVKKVIQNHSPDLTITYNRRGTLFQTRGGKTVNLNARSLAALFNRIGRQCFSCGRGQYARIALRGDMVVLECNVCARVMSYAGETKRRKVENENPC